MKLLPLFLLPFVSIIGSCQTNQINTTNNTVSKPTVIELFTSEGCSSCPSADKLLAELSDKNPGILLLSYHVDYWNRLGWTDSFSNQKFTQRQYDYASHFKLSSVYTPQAVINGQQETTGSNGANINKFISAGHSNQPIITSVNAIAKGNRVAVDVNVDDKNMGHRLWLLLVQPHAVTKVKAGENDGHLLQHKNVVRDMVEWRPSAGTTTLSMPFAANDWKVVILAQDKGNLQISDVNVVDVK